ncbi:hypothetical protein TUM17567_39640 [Citrobacter amalonaticus]|nr:hypothetical protein TUM17567_39640 [Citrobacter amalonaticus]
MSLFPDALLFVPIDISVAKLPPLNVSKEPPISTEREQVGGKYVGPLATSIEAAELS